MTSLRARVERLEQEVSGHKKCMLVVEKYEDDDDAWWRQEVEKLEDSIPSGPPALTVVLDRFETRPPGLGVVPVAVHPCS